MALLVCGILSLAAAALVVRHCGPRPLADKPLALPPVEKIPPQVAAELAATRVEMALAKLDQGDPAEALALSATALRTDPESENAHSLAERLLRGTTWHFPDLEIRHPLPVDRIATDGSASLWVGLGGKTCTVVRWDLANPSVGGVLFPLADTEPRSLVIDPTARRAVVERAGVLLLCDAQTLKPVMDLGGLPQTLTPESVIVFSADGLLMAHPAANPGNDTISWLLRDAGTGQILRRHDPNGKTQRALTAFLDRKLLKVLHEDGTVMSIPVSPVEPVAVETPEKPLNMPHGQYSADGVSWLALIDQGPHQPRELTYLPDEPRRDTNDLLHECMLRFPWSLQPGVWNGLLRDAKEAPLHVEDRTLVMRGTAFAPIHASSPIHAAARLGKAVLVGCDDGAVIRFQLLPAPVVVGAGENGTAKPDEASTDAFGHLAAALCGIEYDESQRRFVALDAPSRIAAARNCDPAALARLFPRLDFQPVLGVLREMKPASITGETMRPLHDRLARAGRSEDSADPAVAAFALALESPSHGILADCLADAENPPPLLRRLAEARIAWLEDRKMEALALWPEPFPDYQRIRLTEDWDGWEQPDFAPLLENFNRLALTELATLELPDGSTAEQRLALFNRLTDPHTARALGRPRLAGFCLKAATGFSAFADEGERALTLATMAYNYGADPASALRAIAHAHAALGKFEQSHERWIQLITELPVETHLPADYAEAAYTAFETSNPTQAMEILLTGTRRFPEDPDFALRAGWIALLTGNPQHAYRFLLTGKAAGFPEDKTEHATILLAIAAAQCGEVFDAGNYYEQLTAMNPEWLKPETIEALEWPEELKATLRQLTW